MPPPLESMRTSSLMASPGDSGSNSWEPLPWLSMKGGFQESLMIPWLKEQSEVPFHMWHRPSEETTVQTQTKDNDSKLG
eukprot:1478731-Ditylum_brightwellii.AAC.1